MSKLTEDPRIDPRIKALFGALELPAQERANTREEMIATANSDEALARREALKTFLDAADSEEIAPSTGLTVTTHQVTSQPDGNSINIQFIRPQSTDALPCV